MVSRTLPLELEEEILIRVPPPSLARFKVVCKRCLENCDGFFFSDDNKWIQTYLMRTDSFWSVKKNTSLGSWVWRKLLKYRDLAKSFYKVEVNNGRRTSFWFDNWSPMGTLFDITGCRGFIDLGIPARSSVAEALSKLRIRNHRQAHLRAVQNMLQTYRDRQARETEDTALWKYSTEVFKPSFNTKKTWLQLRDTGPIMEWHKGVWFTHSTPKFSFFAWLALHNRLATCDRILSWSPGINPLCVFCQRQQETRNHIFFTCGYSNSRHPRIPLFLVRYVFQSAIHTLWRERNSRRHGDRPQPPAKLTRIIDKTVRNRILMESKMQTDESQTESRNQTRSMRSDQQLWFYLFNCFI
ncbi:unnamed protein product [Microthlaspi erraticum]|uniref:Uncharacterized protein n=1 Tax=Microthlaspi erraticum TaxID=1685480 RepID=A0A6D2KHX3_9BRAS|nr:unnamed protein product [Microthlaspi erraticum]